MSSILQVTSVFFGRRNPGKEGRLNKMKREQNIIAYTPKELHRSLHERKNIQLDSKDNGPTMSCGTQVCFIMS